jgi:hypothetical protein
MAKNDLQGTLDLLVLKTLSQIGLVARLWNCSPHPEGVR